MTGYPTHPEAIQALWHLCDAAARFLRFAHQARRDKKARPKVESSMRQLADEMRTVLKVGAMRVVADPVDEADEHPLLEPLEPVAPADDDTYPRHPRVIEALWNLSESAFRFLQSSDQASFNTDARPKVKEALLDLAIDLDLVEAAKREARPEAQA